VAGRRPGPGGRGPDGGAPVSTATVSTTRGWIRRLRGVELYLAVVIVVYIAVVGIVNPLFLDIGTLFDMLRSGAGVALLALGVLTVLVSGGIDVSFTAIAIVSAYVGVRTALATGIDNLWLILFVAVTVGTLLGALNAATIYAFRLPTSIA